MPQMSSSERAAMENRAALEQKREKRLDDFTKGLAFITDFDTEKIEDGDGPSVADYRKDASADLKKILASAATRDAKAGTTDGQGE